MSELEGKGLYDEKNHKILLVCVGNVREWIPRVSDPKERSTILAQVDYFALGALAREPGSLMLTTVR